MNIVNKYKKVKLTAVKKDNETGEVAQGDATLSGAVYGMYEDKACTKLMKQYKTDKNGQFETDYVRCGTDYYLKEITPPTGYLKNDKVYVVDEDGKNYLAEYNSAKSKMELGEDVIKGYVEIIKIMTNGAFRFSLSVQEVMKRRKWQSVTILRQIKTVMQKVRICHMVPISYIR